MGREGAPYHRYNFYLQQCKSSLCYAMLLLCSALDRDHLNSALPYRSVLCTVLEGRA